MPDRRLLRQLHRRGLRLLPLLRGDALLAQGERSGPDQPAPLFADDSFRLPGIRVCRLLLLSPQPYPPVSEMEHALVPLLLGTAATARGVE